MDLSAQRTYNVLVERQGYAFFVDIKYENVPDFCSHCNTIGHSLDACKKLNLDIINKHTRKQHEKTFVKVIDGNINMEKGKDQLNEGVGAKTVDNLEQVVRNQPESNGVIKTPILQNKFQALFDAEKEHEPIVDEELETSKNNSLNSEFVGATQLIVDEDEVIENSLTPTVVKK